MGNTCPNINYENCHKMNVSELSKFSEQFRIQIYKAKLANIPQTMLCVITSTRSNYSALWQTRDWK